MTITTIYGMSDPRDGQLRYVGKTVETIDKRLARHMNDAHRLKNRKDRWLSRLAAKDLRPDIFIIEVVPHGEWVDAERFWIAYYKMIGADLMNHTSGGEGEPGFSMSEDAKARIAAGNRGKPKSPEHVAKILAGPGIFKKGQVPHNAGKTASEETRRRISDVQKGKPKGPQSPEHRANHLAAMKTRHNPPTWSAARRAAHELRYGAKNAPDA